jgi:hypothetical protein
MLVNAAEFEVAVPQDKLKEALALVERMLRSEIARVDLLRTLTGKLVSFTIAMPAVRVWTRSLFAAVARARPGDEFVALDEDAREELLFWKARMPSLNGSPIAAPQFQMVAHADAGSSGWGFWVSDHSACGWLPRDILGTSSTLRELVAVAMGLKALQSVLAGQKLLLQLDSFAAVRNLVKGGGPVPALSDWVKRIWKFCDEQKIRLTAVWIPREQNVRADALSKVADQCWRLSPSGIRRALHAFGAVCGDLHEPIAKPVLLNPTVGMVGTVLREAMKLKRKIVMVCPMWPSQNWWPIVSEMASKIEKVPMADFQEVPSALVVPNWQFVYAVLDFTVWKTPLNESVPQGSKPL